MTTARRRLIIPLLLCLFVPFALPQHAPARTSSKMDEVVRTLFSGVTFDQVAISPDARHVAWVEKVKGGSAIYVSDVGAAVPRRITAGGRAESSIAWSPDSKQMAFLSDAGKPGQQQLYAAGFPGGVPRKLTSVSGF